MDGALESGGCGGQTRMKSVGRDQGRGSPDDGIFWSDKRNCTSLTEEEEVRKEN